MPFIKIGQSTFNNETSAVMLLQGKATRDAENRPVNGKEHTQVSIAAGEDKSGNELYITLNGWRQNAELVGAIKKNDSILAIGRLKTREYNGNIYDHTRMKWSCVADDVRKGKAGRLPNDKLVDTSGASGNGSSMDSYANSGFSSDSDDEIPFD